ncbi:polysaccharide pyruvyl transferase family protein [Halobacillus sp. Marseille-P3879]|uniref:polysaccharide pyruvyl transferase family protein n=1 Tax=Halobacillus sp. Marseille-P3879 TaxID=2045014 RepID=UPI00135CBA74|nr:polysaccharide pyruvyl transferase family protein [Halobacillus sp. Marseille-P3879]
MSYLLLSTYGEKGSRDSGDDLICKSLTRLIRRAKGKKLGVDVFSLVDDSVETVTDISKYRAVIVPALRPIVQGSKLLPPKRSLLLQQAKEHQVPVYVIGAGWGSYPGTFRQAKNQKIIKEDKAQLIGLDGLISTRDFTTEVLLRSNRIPCYGTTGDCALFETTSIGQTPQLPETVKNVALSLPRNRRHWSACYRLALRIKEEFSCDVYITVHEYYGEFSALIPSNWDRHKVYIKDLSGGAEKLSFYKQCDAHIGFRLHAHIWFLRKRKPSLLIAEDGRGMGTLMTLTGLGYSAAANQTWKKADELITFSEKAVYKHKGNEPTVEKAVRIFKNEHQNGYVITRNSLRKIDRLWREKMKPLLQRLP